MKLLWIACAVACSVPQDAPRIPPEIEGPLPHEASEHSAFAEPEPELDLSSVCGRAEVCCHAFANATPNVVAQSTCAGPREAAAQPDADARCERMMLGWRTALERNEDVELPSECSLARE